MNKKGMGLLGLLAAVVIISLLTALVMKQYTKQTEKIYPSLNKGTFSQQKTENNSRQNKTACNGRMVGNMCIPTEVRSASLDAFEEM